MPKTADLLEETATLKAMLIASEAQSRRKDERIERLEKLVGAFRHAAFGRRSEKSDPDQFELASKIWKRPSPQSTPKRMPRTVLPSAPPSHGPPIPERCPNICIASKRWSSPRA